MAKFEERGEDMSIIIIDGRQCPVIDTVTIAGETHPVVTYRGQSCVVYTRHTDHGPVRRVFELARSTSTTTIDGVPYVYEHVLGRAVVTEDDLLRGIASAEARLRDPHDLCRRRGIARDQLLSNLRLSRHRLAELRQHPDTLFTSAA